MYLSSWVGGWAAEWRVCNRRGRCCRRPWQILTRRDAAHWLIGPASFAKHVATGAEKQVGRKAPPVIIPPHSRVGSFPMDARLNLRRLVGLPLSQKSLSAVQSTAACKCQRHSHDRITNPAAIARLVFNMCAALVFPGDRIQVQFS